ncbi:MAG TPA: hypothetical protein VG187_19265 [Mycobacterium sp.]|nr:hypothetical protein [Mycobacterium sp.]
MSTAETQMDLDRITHPLRLARGSHQPGSGKGCAMNAISYTNGDQRITDFPNCSARALAILVQACNDLLAAPGGYLSPEHSVLGLELAWQTVGTAGVADTVVHAWLAELLTNPVWGIVQYANITATKAILDIAELHRRAAHGDLPAIAAWDAADRAARAVADAMSPRSNAAGAFAIRAAYESTTLVNVRHYQSTLDAATAFAVRAHARAVADTGASRMVELAGQAIQSWRHLAGLDNSANETTSVNNRREVVSPAEFVLAR